MNIFFSADKQPLIIPKAWHVGLLQAFKVLPYLFVSAVVTYISSLLPNWHPTTAIAVSEFSLVNFIIVQVQNWIDAHQVIVKAQTPVPQNPVAQPVDSTPPSNPAA